MTYTVPSIDTRYGAYNGTKTNSDYFWYYLSKLYNWREKNGIIPNIIKMDHIITEVSPGDRHAAICELLLMQKYEFAYSFETSNYYCSVLEFPNDTLVPEIVIREPKQTNYFDSCYYLNQNTSVRKNSWARFVGEAYLVNNINDIVAAQKQAGTEFITPEIQGSEALGARFIETTPSPYSNNSVTYVQYYGEKRIYAQSGVLMAEPSKNLETYKAIKQKNQHLSEFLGPIDHLATRVMHQDRENALLEIVKLTHHYPWGAYNIFEQNSSTNPTRNAYHLPEKHSPAKVFTAGNIPSFLSSLDKLNNPTDAFVLSFGRSMHHFAFEITDVGKGSANIDAVVEFLKNQKVEFLGDLYGNKAEGIRQIFSKRSTSLGWITEYVQRFDGFDGFFTRKNVAQLTQAAGSDESLRKCLD